MNDATKLTSVKGVGKAIAERLIANGIDSLEKLADASEQLRHFGRTLAKADAKITKVSDCDVEEVVAGLKKARKKIEDAVE